MINSVNSVQNATEIKETNITSNRQNVTMCRKDFERIPADDSFETKNKSKTGKIVGISLLGLLAVVSTLGLICIKKGAKVLEGKDASFKEKLEAGWKKLRGKDIKTDEKPEKPDDKPAEKTDTDINETKNNENHENPENPENPEAGQKEQAVSKQTIVSAEKTVNAEKISASIEKLKDKKIIDCAPDDIKEFADAVYCDDACASRLFQKCLESNVYKDTQNTLKDSYELTKDFISKSNEYMPEELINSEMLYTPLKDLKVKDVMPNETIEALHNMEKSMRVMLDMPDADISAVIDEIKEMSFLEYYKQSQDSARRIFNDEVVEAFELNLEAIDSNSSILEINLEKYINEVMTAVNK